MLYPLHALNSNLILLIHFVIIFEKRTGIPFKFQSDSINTVASSSQTSVSFPLFKFQSDSINTEERSHNKGKNLTLNSNLILLIHVFTLKYKDRMYFKFQSDSINTVSYGTRDNYSSEIFKFQSDSINTGQRKRLFAPLKQL